MLDERRGGNNFAGLRKGWHGSVELLKVWWSEEAVGDGLERIRSDTFRCVTMPEFGNE